jgi:predicted DNA-binding transcriptional regulator AlpA
MKEIRLFDTIAAAAYLGMEPGTLENWRYKGLGPRVIHLGRSVRYDRSDLDAWIEAQKGAA